MSSCRGIRGATSADANTKEAIVSATKELLEKLIEANNLKNGDVAAAIFTTTQDLTAEFPAVAARKLGWQHVALMCSHEMAVPDGQPRCIRALVLVNTDLPADRLVNVYLKDAKNLRARGMES